MFRSLLLPMVMIALQVSVPVAADEDAARLDALAQEVETLRRDVARLQRTVDLLNAIRPTVTTLMPSVSERFHVMHYAGDAEDWALAAHELLGIEHLLEVMQRVDPEKAAMAEAFLAPNFNRLDAAIDHGDRSAFVEAVTATVASCNACHVAAGSPFMVVSLDPANSLSLRHAHQLRHSEKPGEHSHTH